MRTFNALTTLGMRQVVARAARHADALIAVTAAARDEITAELALEPSRFSVIHHGATLRARGAASDRDDVRRRYGLGDGPIVLCVGSKRPHKNQGLLVRAARLLSEAIVVLAGHPEPYDRELRALARELEVEPRVRFADYVAERDLGTLWELAACAAFPTLAEGFGMPVLEALARGVPVAASDIPVLHEVGGELPHFFDARSPESAAAAIVAAMADERTRAAGPEWAARFTWARAAEATWEVYERACASA
jgi:glycosyltransferase involved in cell wall biosynthesis